MNQTTTLKRQKLRNNEYYQIQTILDDLYASSQKGKIFKKLMIYIISEENILLAYRNIKKNHGSKTPGYDGKTIQCIEKITRSELVELVRKRLANYFPQKVRRVFIPKANGKMRPLGIPTIQDRIIQQCIYQILEPICEAKFYKHSYGFRPLRSARNAIAWSYNLAQHMQLHYVVDVDIKGFFDNIDHGKLLKQIWSLGIRDKQLISVISKMLKAEIEGEGIPTKGTPQGGILSPLLANIALNELDWWVASQWENPKTRYAYRPEKNGANNSRTNALRKTHLKEMYVVRYADDFKIFCRTNNHAQRTFVAVKDWLWQRLKLEISEEKSKVTNLRKSYSEFLGIKIKLYPKGKRINRRFSGKKYVVRSHIVDKAMDRIRKSVKKFIVETHRCAGNDFIQSMNKFNGYIIGVHNYYNMATLCANDLSQIAYLSLSYLRRKLHPRRIVKDDKIPEYIKSRYGKSKQLRIVRKRPLVPIAYVKYSRVNIFGQLSIYKDKDRETIHNNQRVISPIVIKQMLENAERNESVQFNDNKISLMVGQRGRCAITGKDLEIDDVSCIRKTPKELDGTDEYNNLIIVSRDVKNLISAKSQFAINMLVRELCLTKEMIRKVNELRNSRGLQEIA